MREQADVLAAFEDGEVVGAEIRVFAALIEDESLSFANAKRGLLRLANQRMKNDEKGKAEELRTAAQEVDNWIQALATTSRKGGL